MGTVDKNGRERMYILIAAVGEGIDLVLDSIQSELSSLGSSEEIEVDLEGALLDGGSEIATRMRSVFGIESGESVERSHNFRAVRPTLQYLLQFTRQPRRQPHRPHFSLVSSLIFLLSIVKI